MNLSISHQAIQHAANIKILESINQRGLCSLNKIPSGILTNPVLQTQNLDGNICVNYLNFENASTAEIVQAVQVAVFEEYCGVYGISLERQWPFQRFESKALFHQEMFERLNHSIVFLLAPPTLGKGIYPSMPQSVVASYTLSRGEFDGITQSRGRNLLDCSTDSCTRISEIKTTHHFHKREICAAFVPEGLYEVARAILKDIQVIPVTPCIKKFRAIPEILKIFHSHVLNQELSLTVPDYCSAIFSHIQQNKIKECSLHAVRLQTQFDFITRKVKSIVENADILEKTSSTIQHVYPDNSAWIIVHKNYGFSKVKLFEQVKKYLDKDLDAKNHFNKMQRANAECIALCEGLIKAKGEEVLTYLYQPLTQYQKKSLDKIGVGVIEQTFYNVLSFKETLKPQVEKINRTRHQSAVHLQACFRGFLARKIVDQYKKKKQQLTLVQLEYNLAESALKKLVAPEIN